MARELLNRLGGLTPEFIKGNIRTKLFVALFLLSIVPLIALGLWAYYASKGALEESTKESLRALAATKSRAIKKHYADREKDMYILLETVKALRSKGYDQLAAMQQLKKNLVETYFTERMSDVNVMSRAPIVSEALAAFEATGGRVGSAAWKQVEKQYGPYLVQFAESYGYYDAYIVSKRGKILYTVAQEYDLGQNLVTGKLKDSPAGKAFGRGLKELVFQDFEPYEPADNEPAAFIACPVRSGRAIKGVIMVQASVDQINYIMQERTGLGRTGESYLIGPDGLFRSDSVHIENTSTIMNSEFQITDDPKYKQIRNALNDALNDNTGQAIIRNFRNTYVLTSWTPVHIQDQTWAMFSEIEVTEAFVPKAGAEEKDFFTHFKEEYGFSDLGLMEPDGELFFTVNKGLDYGKNMLSGKYKKSNLGELLLSVKQKKAMGFSDFESYAPLSDAGEKETATAFFAIPLLSPEGDLEVAAIARLSPRENNTVMGEKLGETGETYLVGKDKKFRSKSRHVKNAVMNKTVDTKAVTQALKNKPGTDEIKNYQQKDVLSVWGPLDVWGNVRWAVIAEMGMEEIRGPAQSSAFWIAVGLMIMIVIVFGVYVFISRGLTTQLTHITELFEKIKTGNYDARTPVTTNDELGRMAESLNSMLDNTMALIQSKEEKDAMQKSIMKLLEEISGLADGDLARRAEVTEDFTGAIADSFNNVAEQLGGVVRHVKDATLQVSSTSKEVRTSTEKLAETSEVQAVQVSDAIAAINEMAASIQQVAENATQCADVSEKSTGNAKDGATAVRDTNAAMDSIREHVQETARAIKRLGESSQEVGNIVQLINDIADRTSILALNASIQAAMAGEAGRGFAVVAEEVQRLAERSTNATKQIDSLIKNIQGEINEAGSSMEESIQRVVEGSKLADGAYTKLQEIEKVTIQLGELIQSISMASKQQARASENIAKTMEEVGEISSQTSAASRQTAVAMKNLADTSDELNESVSVFTLDES